MCLCAVPTKVKTIKKEYLLKRLFMMRGNSLFWHGGLGHRQLFQGIDVRKPLPFKSSNTFLENPKRHQNVAYVNVA